MSTLSRWKYNGIMPWWYPFWPVLLVSHQFAGNLTHRWLFNPDGRQCYVLRFRAEYLDYEMVPVTWFTTLIVPFYWSHQWACCHMLYPAIGYLWRHGYCYYHQAYPFRYVPFLRSFTLRPSLRRARMEPWRGIG